MRIGCYTFFKHLLPLALMVMLVQGCQMETEPKTELQKIRERGVLRVGTVNNHFSYYISPTGPTGIDYELAKAFADELGVKLQIKQFYKQSSLYPALANGQIDIIAAGLSQSESRLDQFRPGPIYYRVSQNVVYKKGTWRPRNINQLVDAQQKAIDEGNLVPEVKVVDDSHFKSNLLSIKDVFPAFKYSVDPTAEKRELLKQVAQGKLNFTVADSIDIALAQRSYPELTIAFEIADNQPISWFIKRSRNEDLYAMMIEFFGRLNDSEQLAQLKEKYLGHIDKFDFVDTRSFLRALDTTLPKWVDLFQQHAQDFDWRLIAALSYQESHWNPKAKSPTGVRGMMMLTLATAKSVNVSNRLDPEQSIRGGVDYLTYLVGRIPETIPDHEKIWFALASYNIGYGHMMDTRRLTESYGGNPNSWNDVKKNLPLLREVKHYSKTRYGYARGDEALNYVENIRRYYQSIIDHSLMDASTESQENTDFEIIAPKEESKIFTQVSNNKSETELITK